jgi:hypothetical protein
MTTSASSSSHRHLVKIATLFLLILSVADALVITRARKTALRLSSEVVADTASSSSISSNSSKSSSSSTTAIDKFVKPPRLIPEDPSLLPTLYNYDHCPFCVRVRLALGFKNVKHNLIFMANDDVHMPSALVGKKIAPIMVRIFCF